MQANIGENHTMLRIKSFGALFFMVNMRVWENDTN